MSSRGPGSIPVAIARLGFSDPARAKSLLDDPALADLIHSRDHIEAEGLAAALGEVPDPDGALLGLVRFMESVANEPGLRAPVTAALDSPRDPHASGCSRCSAARPPSATTCAPTPSTGRR